ncbi:MAG: calcium-translocating P-type ATPase, SERCA-type [Candidatus Infernicultor aquiphilus]|uniref:Calcium-translocating P-type ATPase, SERCA-type n=1 Tax=Candidatus Infernicultor aquiphilus TaxID=1805029 RepID=A0A2M8CG87_9BACT|nr:calcium-translocating P-type ATPase, SERCA-type [bacterium]PIU24834.1 MAG: calcium-translocating P-type ATPase, SERCA-type [Candidatus Atribacteria bacterium CG08_land_8_20_14_0_20_33_29]PIW11191.1 MAG: calcium-translocating P-type ATPase, SERCA-type [Candidatus Atribacteria bacterium CG17_big_fil_post_rev_8_21_14_2_50_34_11]PIX33636.1 MAG: calcium-translocating P-type ATPase, SERCA-type [Candidatus Atribacteria bacterium CG_4_8_14_3_um_filter_34_18]PIY33972.1 MAG: calcium-translocating P-ty
MKKCYQQSIDEVVQYSKTDLKIGLSSPEVKKRLDEVGPNQLEEKKGRTPWDMFLGQFKDVLVLILLISALVSFILGEVSDAMVIAIILILNATLGVVQEYKAEKSLAALKKMTTPNALVIRDGKQARIEATQLVPGDIVLLESGDHIPADLRLSMVTSLKIQEAVLTGESLPVEKTAEIIDKDNISTGDQDTGDQDNMAFMGTAVISGRGRGIVVATGMKTEMGQIAGMLEEQKQEDTPLQKKLNQVGKKLGLIILVVVGLVVLIGSLRGIKFFEMFLIGISLAVAAVPEGLPAVVTVVLALGVQRMIKKNVIVRRLPAVETLGATTVICSDKTGTLTQNQMTVRKLVLPEKNIEVEGEGYRPVGKFYQSEQEIQPQTDPDLSLLLRGAVLCNNAELQKNNENNQWEIIGDPTEGALVVTAAKAGYDKKKLEQDYPRVKEFPFDSDRKQMSTLHQTPDGSQIIFVKGAPDQVISFCTYYQKNGTKEEMGESIKNKVLAQNRELAVEALRVLAIAYRLVDKENLDEIKEIKDAEKELIFLGLIAMIDPPRKEAIESVKTCLRAGIHPIMITGDYSLTAKAIASELGIYHSGDRIITGEELEKMSPSELEEAVGNTTIFARVSPRHKRRIVSALQKNKQVVAMTGDGVNDAPALKESDIGIAMGITGTDVTKEASDMILTDDNFASIVGAVEEGRKIYQNIKKFIHYLISCNLGEIITIAGAIFIGLPYPLIPIQILWVNLVTDGLPALALGLDPAEKDIMQMPPRDPNKGIFSGKMGFNIFSQGIFIGLLSLSAFYIGISFYSLEIARTMAFATLSFSQLAQSLNARSQKFSIFRIGLFTNLYLIMAIFISGLLQFLVMVIPSLQVIFKTVWLDLNQWWIVVTLSLAPIIYVEFLKLIHVTGDVRPCEKQ